jgi:DNA-binding MarR family transcriptional regulator
LIYSTYIGGPKNDSGFAITVDKDGNIYLTGETFSPTFPTTNGSFDRTFAGNTKDGFILKLNPNGSTLIYSTFFGGKYWDDGDTIILDCKNNVYVTGDTGSPDFPTTNGSYKNTTNGGPESFILKLNSNGTALIFSTYVGGSLQDNTGELILDSNENLYLVGSTTSTDFPYTIDSYDGVHNGGLSDAYFIILNSTGGSLLYSTYIGGNGYDQGIDIGLDSNHNYYITGLTNSTDFPHTTNTIQNGFSGPSYNWDGYLMKFKAIFPNNAPSILNLNISKSQIFEYQDVTLYSNASDIEDIEEELVTLFQYRDPNNQFWNSTNFSQSFYNKSRWEVKFTPPTNSPLGTYDFRVRCEDTVGLFSSWFYLYDHLTVKKKEKEQKPISEKDIKENVTLLLLLDKNKYYLNENITGQIKIINNNSIDIFTVFPDDYGTNITIEPNILFEINESKLGTKYYSWDTQILKIGAKSNLIYNFTLDGFNVTIKKWPNKHIQLPIGNYSINSSWRFYAQNNISFNFCTYTKHFKIIDPKSEFQNISIILRLSKHEFYYGEPITGNITIFNNNSFDIILNQTVHLKETLNLFNNTWFAINRNLSLKQFIGFSILNLDNLKIFGAIHPEFQNITLKSNTFITSDFELLYFFEFSNNSDSEVNSTFLNISNYSMHLQFLYNNLTSLLSAKSNNVTFKVIPYEIPVLENISINLELTKEEYELGEPINGSITISNDNIFDVFLEDNIFHQRLGGHNLELYSIETRNEFGAIIKNLSYPIKINAQSAFTISFSLKQVIKQSMNSKELSYLQLGAGNYSMFAFFYYTNFSESIKLYSNIEYFRIIPNISGPIIQPGPPPPTSSRKGTSTSFMIIVGISIFIVIITITTAFISSTEVGKYTFFKGFIIPLYTKSRRKKMDKNYGYKKGLVLGYILGNPGENYNSIKKVLNLNNGALTYYLRILEREGTIRSERDGMYKRFYPTKANITSEVLELSDVQKNIYQTIKEHLGITQKEISEQLGMAQQTVNYHIQLMEQARIIKLDREGKKSKCFILLELS